MLFYKYKLIIAKQVRNLDFNNKKCRIYAAFCVSQTSDKYRIEKGLIMRKKRQTASSIAKAAVQEVKDSAKDILNTPIVEKAKETVKDAAEKAEDTVKTVTKAAKDAGNRVSSVTLEVSGLDISLEDIKKAVKKDAAEKGLNGTIRIYLNVAQMAAYYAVDEKGSDEYKVDFVRI